MLLRHSGATPTARTRNDYQGVDGTGEDHRRRLGLRTDRDDGRAMGRDLPPQSLFAQRMAKSLAFEFVEGAVVKIRPVGNTDGQWFVCRRGPGDPGAEDQPQFDFAAGEKGWRHFDVFARNRRGSDKNIEHVCAPKLRGTPL